MKILVFEIFEKGQISRPFLGLAPLKLKKKKLKFNGSICAYRVFYPPIFRKIEGGWNPPPPPRSLRYRKKRGPERVNRGTNFRAVGSSILGPYGMKRYKINRNLYKYKQSSEFKGKYEKKDGKERKWGKMPKVTYFQIFGLSLPWGGRGRGYYLHLI